MIGFERAHARRSPAGRRGAKLLLTLLLAVFLPASILAAPLRECVAGSGHHQIEFFHHRFDARAPHDLGAAIITHRRSALTHMDCGHCRDRSLVAEATISHRLRPAIIGKPRPDPVSVKTVPFPRPVANIQRDDRLQARTAEMRHPHLVAIGTIVLLN
jgi:hypothetical protein